MDELGQEHRDALGLHPIKVHGENLGPPVIELCAWQIWTQVLSLEGSARHEVLNKPESGNPLNPDNLAISARFRAAGKYVCYEIDYVIDINIAGAIGIACDKWYGCRAA